MNSYLKNNYWKKKYSGNHTEQTDSQKRLLQNLYERIVPCSYAGIGAVLGAVPSVNYLSSGIKIAEQ
ncbi:hypothetical protein [Candidatus Contubernalis alkaliaceticus]|uniref:hypothetical protein n=1 Tax=Candidatus Contubernalis alkaliaceticus TaxID=338645 RepID=UPI001F4BE268|nr:hypothetical protein [Candidatus Contubernalis alkalaceticus]UNC92121.1 hypothetical protein HUE98_08435 [Candidatus Contubernalis alkalaceticus]